MSVPPRFVARPAWTPAVLQPVRQRASCTDQLLAVGVPETYSFSRMKNSSPVEVDGTNVWTRANQVPLLTPVNWWTISAAPETRSAFGVVNDWLLTTVALAPGRLSQ